MLKVRARLLNVEHYPAIASEAAGDVEATALHDEWLAVFDGMLTSLRASLHLGQVEYNGLLLATEAA